ncbi:aladin [Nilaparvata lugens]|uniref:aladin n=1 Tax=Nilaparvata lugens TaxID=108931 RepID=UPI000B98A816|nr:aladin [Nilaparvata lugens]
MNITESLNRICSLEHFPPPPSGDSVPLCETEGRLIYCLPEFVNLHLYTKAVDNLPEVVITRDMLHNAAAHSNINVFLPVTENIWKRLQNAWYENGFREALQIAAQSEEDVNSLLKFCSIQTLSLMNKVNRICSRIPLLSSKDTEIQQQPGGKECIVCIEWHPHCKKIALATRDDSVRVFSSHTKLVPLLKCKVQRNVSCLAWRPLSTSDLAVGCASGILIWTVDPNSVVMRPSSSTAVLLQRKDHTEISSIAFSADGSLLVSASRLNQLMMVWEVSTERATCLKRIGGGGISLVTWAPDNRKVFAATSRLVFRVWSSWQQWVPERWSLASGHVVSACWSPCSSALLFVTSLEPTIYALTFGQIASVFTTEDRRGAVRVADLTAISVPSGNRVVRVGGEVNQMVWDGRGRHLAVTFHDSDLIAVFLTNISTTVHVSPCCFIKGEPGEKPNVITFQKNFEEGANLTIAWSSHRVQYFPFIYQELGSSNTIGSPGYVTGPLESSLQTSHIAGKSYSDLPSFMLSP